LFIIKYQEEWRPCQSVPSYTVSSTLIGAMATVLVHNTTFNNISVISWRSVLLVEETRVPGENHLSRTCQWQTLLHNVVSSAPRH